MKAVPEADTVIRVLYDLYRLPPSGYVLRSIGGDHQYAEEIVQETMVRAWQQASELDVERAGRWLISVARHLIISGHLPSRVVCGGGVWRIWKKQGVTGQ